MARCANPDCPDDVANAFGGLTNHWVQLEEVNLVGQRQGEGPLQRPFAAVACSKRCAAAVLLAAADADDAAAAQQKETRERSYDQPLG